MTDHAHLLNTFNRQNCLIAGTGLGLPDVPTKWIASDLGASVGVYNFEGAEYLTVPEAQSIGAEYPDEPHFICTYHPNSPQGTEFLYSPEGSSGGLKDVGSVSNTVQWSAFGVAVTIGNANPTEANEIALYFKTGAIKGVLNGVIYENTSVTWTTTSWNSSHIASDSNGNFKLSGVIEKFCVDGEQWNGSSLTGSNGTVATLTGTEAVLFSKVLKNGIIRDASKQPDYMVITDGDSMDWRGPYVYHTMTGTGLIEFPQISILDGDDWEINCLFDMDNSLDGINFLGDNETTQDRFRSSLSGSNVEIYFTDGTPKAFDVVTPLQSLGETLVTFTCIDRLISLYFDGVLQDTITHTDMAILIDNFGFGYNSGISGFRGDFKKCSVAVNGVLLTDLQAQADGKTFDYVSQTEIVTSGTGTTTTSPIVEANANGSTQVNTILAVTSGDTLTLAQWVAKHNGTTIFIAEDGLRYAIFDTAQTGLDLDRALRWVGRFVVVAFVYSLDFSNSANSMYAPVVF